MATTSTETIHVRAVRWEGGWELHVSDTDVTQSRTLVDAEKQVRDYLESMYGDRREGETIKVVPELDGIEDEVVRVRSETAQAAEAQRLAAEHSRELAWRLRREAGLSVTDTAAVLGVSRGRVSQLMASPH